MSAFHFDTLVWHWPIAIYLFLAGASAGAMFFAVLLKHVCLKEKAYQSGFVQAACIVAAIAVLAGLGILVLDLTKPWDFWKILVFYNPTSVMSMGVLILMLYQVFMYAWIAITFRQPIDDFCKTRLPIVGKLTSMLARYEAGITGLLVIFSVSLGAYTGFLLSAQPHFPMWNTPVLPLLFLVSGLSSGAAASLLGGVLLKGSPNGQEVRFIHKVEIPLILGEMLLIFTFFLGLVFSGGQSKVAAFNAIGEGFWGLVFWFGIMGLGLSAPLAMNLFMTATSKRKYSYVAGTACLSLLGVILLRNFVLYTGQMVVN
ncbi:MAG: cytochrome c nitrite reductase subunit NrfD [Shewanella psychromarinicola]|jgi:protein NrfD|uniref:Cytochrome c nitrite reductase subunit NrfD n=1 Tax=Shewanella psychromarinicola TaxID=2487742 RepID=A0A3N4D992_9GAMM|nr:cytochrome c nitrite reductase subunit NrfD [Shewanella psychromarinicola]AZG33673.1 cytochrome c nitrite reductase subunit NrfD [Shewanella psychromarinicola]MCL1084299.1 cytochrome c nitrite reductase subunit NrfD [Shewanella psychromarinicola]RPA22495.1 cytochrome c nitrite reductase subunit NrfD [Shewanella psychromarinicola]|tara:strand:+ start:33177 stop:34118 length:942 start_codon:yes stop_codon:yes gene_type:complete